MKVNAVTPKYTLSESTLRNIEIATKLSGDEMRKLSLEEARDLMIKRGVIKKHNPIKEFIKDMYQRLGRKLGLLETSHYRPYIYTDID
ncbi:hypothetical protein IJ732_00240 [bacterium]|nr:hypothetical protein [bacterium]